MARYKKDIRHLIKWHSCGEDYIALADCLGIKRNFAYTIVRRGRYKNLAEGGSYSRKIDEEVILGAIDILEGNQKMQEELDLFINADALQEPGQTFQDYRFRHVKSIVERTSCEITPEKCVGWYNHTMTYIPDCLARNKNDG